MQELLSLGWPLWATMAVAAILAASTVIVGRRQRRATQTAWQQAADDLGLHLTWGTSPRMEGRIDGVAVEVAIAYSQTDVGNLVTRFTIRSPSIPPHLSVRAEGLLTRVGAALGMGDLQTGDRDFDDAVHVTGEEIETLSLLDGEARRLLSRFVANGRGRIEAGELIFERPLFLRDSESIVRRARALVRLARQLGRKKETVAAALLRNVQKEEDPGVRSRILQVLLRRFPHGPEASRACAWALENLPDPPTQLLAGRHLGPAGWDYLQRLVAGDAPDAVRSAALDHLVATMPHERLIPFLEHVLEVNPANLWPAVLRALGGRGPAAAFGRTAGLAPGGDGPIATAVAEVLWHRGEARAEPVLTGLLLHPDAKARAVAAATLGEIGTIRAVEPLLACEQAASLLEGDVRKAARAAIEAIQRRLGPVDAGRLSLAEAQGVAGALSEVKAEGALSLAGEEARPAPAPTRPTDEAAAQPTQDRTTPGLRSE